MAGAVCLRHGGKFSFESLTFDHFLYKNRQKAFSFRRALPLCPPPGDLPVWRWTPPAVPPTDPV